MVVRNRHAVREPPERILPSKESGTGQSLATSVHGGTNVEPRTETGSAGPGPSRQAADQGVGEKNSSAKKALAEAAALLVTAKKLKAYLEGDSEAE